MLRTLSYILAFVCAGALCSCINDDARILEPDYDICFDVAVASVTKSNDYPTDVPFKLWALYSSEDQESSRQYIEGEEVHYSDGVWKTDLRHPWPDSLNLTFYAVSPTESGAEFSVDQGIMYPDFNLTTDEDFLCTILTDEYEKPETDEPISIMFSSPLCRLEFSAFSSAYEGVELYVTRITLLGLNMTGDFRSLPELKWSGLREAADVVLFEGRLELSEDAVAIGESMNIIPQDLQIKVEYEYRITSDDPLRYGEKTVYSGTSMRPECGKWRPYQLKISTECVEIQKPKKYEE